MLRRIAPWGLLLLAACSSPRPRMERAARRGTQAFVDRYALPAVVALEAGLVKEAELYRAAHFLLYRDLLGLPIEDPLVVRARDHFLKSMRPDGSWIWSRECGCLQPKVLLGLLNAGVSPDDPRIQRAADWWIAWGRERWGGTGWGECFSRELIEGRRNPLSLDVTCSPNVDLEYSMKAALMLLKLGRDRPVVDLLKARPTLSSWGIDLQRRFYDAEGLAWVLVLARAAEERGVDLGRPPLVSEAEGLARQILGGLDLYPQIRGCPVVEGDLLRALVAYGGSVDPILLGAAEHLLTQQREDGSWPFDAGVGFGDFPRPRGTLDGSATVASASALKQILRVWRKGEKEAGSVPLAERPPGLPPSGIDAAAIARIERFVTQTVARQIERLRRATYAQVDEAMRRHNDYSIHTAYYDVIEYLMYHRDLAESPERDATARAALDVLRRFSAAPEALRRAPPGGGRTPGIPPGFDTQCIGMRVLYAMGVMGLRRGDPWVERNRARLLELRRDGGWLQLEYTFGRDPEGKPWEPEVEKTAKGMAGLLEVGEDPREPLLQEAREALERAVVERRYKESHAMDWDVGIPWAMAIAKRFGLRDPEAFQVLEDELVRMAMDERDPILQNPYLMGLVALGLEGVLPPDAAPLARAFGKMTSQFLPGEGRFTSRDLFYHPDFPRSARHSMKPLFALENLGAEAAYLPFPAPPLPEVPRLRWSLPVGAREVRVSGIPAGTEARMEWASGEFASLGRVPLIVREGDEATAPLPEPRPPAVRALLLLPGPSGPVVRWSPWVGIPPSRSVGAARWGRVLLWLLVLAALAGGGALLGKALLRTP